jgi:hypothetical protein
MKPEQWITLLSVAVSVLAIAVPVILRKSDQRRVELEKLREANRVLEKTNLLLNVQLMRFLPVAESLDKLLSGLPGGEKP